MLYIHHIPVEDKSSPHNLNLELNLDKTQSSNQNGLVSSSVASASSSHLSPSSQIINFERQIKTTILKSPPSQQQKSDKSITTTAQRPKSLVKPNNNQTQLTSMEINLTECTGKIDGGGGSSSGGSILATSSVGASSDEGKKVKMSKIGNTKNAALKR